MLRKRYKNLAYCKAFNILRQNLASNSNTSLSSLNLTVKIQNHVQWKETTLHSIAVIALFRNIILSCSSIINRKKTINKSFQLVVEKKILMRKSSCGFIHELMKENTTTETEKLLNKYLNSIKYVLVLGTKLFCRFSFIFYYPVKRFTNSYLN